MDGSVSLDDSRDNTTVTNEELASPVANIATTLQGERFVLDAAILIADLLQEGVGIK